MITFLRRRFPRRFLLILMLSTACAVIVAACSSSNGGAGSSAQQIRSGSGWAPQGSLAVVSVDISSTGIDTALATLQRLPSFHLVTAQLPAPQKGAQAREQLVNLLLNAGDSKCSGTNLAPLKGSGKKSPSSKCPSYQHDVAPWLGNEAGLAVLPSPRASGARQHTPRVVGWIESTDDAKAAAFIKQHAKTIKGTAEQNGDSLDSWSAPKSGGGVTVGVLDGAVLIGASRVDLLEVVHAHKDSSTVLGPITDQLTALRKNRQLAAVVDVNAVYTEGLTQLKSRKDKASQRAYQALNVDSLRSWLPKVAGLALGVDKAGIRGDFAYSPATDRGTAGLTDVLTGAPATATMVSAGKNTGLGAAAEHLARVWQDEQDKGVVKAADITGLATKCPPKAAALCALGTRLMLSILDGSAAKAIATPRADGPFAMMSLAGKTPGASTTFGYLPAPTDGGVALAARAQNWLVQLNAATKPFGVTFKLIAGKALGNEAFTATVGGATLKKAGFNPAGPAGKALLGSLATSGLDIVKVRGGGLQVSAASSIADGRQYYAFPAKGLAPSIAALNGGPHLGDSPGFKNDLAAANLPDKLGAVEWINLTSLAGNIVNSVTSSLANLSNSTDKHGTKAAPANPAIGIMNLNFKHVGGLLNWSEFATHGGTVTSTSHLLIPLYEAEVPVTNPGAQPSVN